LPNNAVRWGKPAKVHGLECRRVIADTPPAKIEELVHLESAARWENGTAKKGPWSDIFNAVVP
jgi:hypothetical protein